MRVPGKGKRSRTSGPDRVIGPLGREKARSSPGGGRAGSVSLTVGDKGATPDRMS
ncbi:hypothetical protein Sfulv_35550 [Streptomyces fulvorobeus]|uniref:Uncharacterized protein n=1 Tax=Streptomyces fulvorobeus TaxID=284028 RepID=A0A7J0CA48_9ACTN|nr:hypothetical protein [Streptomyces fulvorobeus]GFM98744.1 hypothetical protein Sfulv_35550 [Streptomyces fulvorobeus]